MRFQVFYWNRATDRLKSIKRTEWIARNQHAWARNCCDRLSIDHLWDHSIYSVRVCVAVSWHVYDVFTSYKCACQLRFIHVYTQKFLPSLIYISNMPGRRVQCVARTVWHWRSTARPIYIRNIFILSVSVGDRWYSTFVVLSAFLFVN